ncbi:MAG: histidine phosphatase family protein [Lachnospiraceae bacterium]|nr:histidine phosphatase family protein [Lachnospiraceae bacterium]
MRLILVRHGDPDYEKDCLTELGHRQAETVAKRLLSEGIAEIFASPLGRARETAQHFSETSGIEEIHILDFMREIRFGKEDALYQSGNPWLYVLDLVHEGADLQSPDWRNFPGFVDNTATVDVDRVQKETDKWLETLGYRREGLYYRCTNDHMKEKTIVLFSHGGSSTAFLSRVLNLPFPHLCVLLGRLNHTAITILRFGDTPGTLYLPIVEVASDSGHLSEVGAMHDLKKIR